MTRIQDPIRERTAMPAKRTGPTSALLGLQAIFQVVIAVLLHSQRDEFVRRLTGSSVAATHNAAVGVYQGALGVHIALAVVFAVSAARARLGRLSRVRVSIPLAVTAIGGVAALWLPAQTWLSPVGVVLAVAALVVIWRPLSASTGVRGALRS